MLSCLDGILLQSAQLVKANHVHSISKNVQLRNERCWAGALESRQRLPWHITTYSLQACFMLTLLQCTAAAQMLQQHIIADALTGYLGEYRVP